MSARPGRSAEPARDDSEVCDRCGKVGAMQCDDQWLCEDCADTGSAESENDPWDGKDEEHE